ncbi:MAG: zinc carboxypeptidase, partial [Bacteroidota bacterium]
MDPSPSFNIPYASVKGKNWNNDLLGNTWNQSKNKPQPSGPVASPYAYLMEWDDYYAPNALNRLLQADLLAKVAHQPFTSVHDGKSITYPVGTILIPVGNNQKTSPAALHALLEEISLATGVTFIPANTGFTPQGIDLGSPSFSILKKPEVLLLVGDGVSSYDAGEVWHLLDQRYDLALTMMETSDFSRRNINRYNTIIMVDGSYGRIGNSEKLKQWLRQGGTLITVKNAIRWARSTGLAGVSFKTAKKEDRKRPKSRPYNKLGADNGARVIGGAIFETAIDRSHPLCYGYSQNNLPVFRRGTLFLNVGQNPYSTPIRYTSNPLLSGYISSKNLDLLKSSASLVVSGFGRGRVICMADNPNFRAFWYGT